MRIETSQVALTSQHTASTTESRHELLRYWVGDSRPAGQLQARPLATTEPKRQINVGDRLELSVAMRQMLAQSSSQASVAVVSAAKGPHGKAMDGKSSDGEDGPSGLDADTIIAEGLLEALTGERVRIRPADIEGRTPAADAEIAKAAAAARDSQATTEARPERAGWGFEYRYDAVRDERENTSFTAEGHVTTADGREIDFSLATEMKREYHSEEHVAVQAGDAIVKDPLVLNFGGPVGALTEERVQFDLNTDGQAEAMPFAGPGSGFLVYDRDSDGTVDNGSELFGPTSGDGFAELAVLDADGNQWLDEADPAYSQLKVWTRDGGSDTVSSLQQRQVGAIYLGSTATPFSVRDASNGVLGEVRESGVFLCEDGRVGAVQRIDVRV